MRTKRTVIPLTRPKLLCEQAPGAIVAYGLRKLSNSYTGPCIRVRRSSDNAERDINFRTHGIDVDTLLAFCGSGSGFVTTWYDQSGNGRNAVQATTTTQPRIVNAGVVHVINGRPAMNWQSAGNNLVFNGLSGLIPSTNSSYSMVAYIDSTTSTFARLLTAYKMGDATDFNATTSLQLSALNGTSAYLGCYQGASYQNHPQNILHQVFARTNNVSGGSNIFVDSVQKLSNTRSIAISTANNLILGAGAASSVIGSSPLIGYMNELVLWTINIPDNDRLIIQASQADFYNISMNPCLLDRISEFQGVGFSVRRIRRTYTGPCIRVRRSSDSAEQDIGFTVDGDLDTASLLSFCGADDGFVKTWYDQSIQARNATQATTTKQPKIVVAGTLNTQNSRPSILFDGANTYLDLSGTALTTMTANITLYSVHVICQSTNNATTQVPYIVSTNTSATAPRCGFRKSTSNTLVGQGFTLDADTGATTASTADSQTLTSYSSICSFNTPLITFFKNGTQVGTAGSGMTSGNTSNTASATARIGAAGSTTPTQFWNGNISEIIYKQSNSTIARQIAERNQGVYYGITVA